MNLEINVEIAGAKKAIIGLRKVDPELRKAFNRNVAAVVKPVITDMKQGYPALPPISGLKRSWKVGGRFKAFPYDQKRAQKGVRYKIDTSRSATSVIRIQQTDPGTVMYETIGKGGSTAFSRRLSAFAGPAVRVTWPAWEKNKDAVQNEIRKLVLEASRIVERELGQ